MPYKEPARELGKGIPEPADSRLSLKEWKRRVHSGHGQRWPVK